MKWITKQEVRGYATTPARALGISIRHHQQIVDATEDELGLQSGVLDGELCGLCYYYGGFFRALNNGGCEKCPLWEDGLACFKDNSLFKRAQRAYEAEPFDHKAFIKAETALLNRLKQLKSGDKSMDKKQKLEQVIETLKKDLDKAQRELAEAEVTYSIGDRFKKSCVKHLLVQDKGRIVLVNLKTGQAWNEPERVGNCRKITEKEFKAICGGEGGCLPDAITRYWDNRKQVLV